MKREDAPPPGWYPDPRGGARLRYWEGLDWGDRYRAPPVAGAYVPEPETAGKPLDDEIDELEEIAGRGLSQLSRADSQAVITEVRQAARQEAERAAQMFGEQARSTVQSVEPLISDYAGRASSWLKRAATIAIALFVLYMFIQAYAQASLFDWIGDRIDNVTDDAAGAALVLRR